MACLLVVGGMTVLAFQSGSGGWFTCAGHAARHGSGRHARYETVLRVRCVLAILAKTSYSLLMGAMSTYKNGAGSVVRLTRFGWTGTPIRQTAICAALAVRHFLVPLDRHLLLAATHPPTRFCPHDGCSPFLCEDRQNRKKPTIRRSRHPTSNTRQFRDPSGLRRGVRSSLRGTGL